MSLAIALNNALSALNVNQQAFTVLSQNIANVNTEGYSRKVINQQAMSIDGTGAGVEIASITRKVDDFLQKSVQLQQGSVSMAQSLSDFSDQVQLLLGTPGGSNSIDSYVTGFFQSLQTLANTPDSGAMRLNAVNGGVTIARQLSDLATGLEGLRYNADQQISQNITQLNSNIQQLSVVNTALANAYALKQPQGELLDQRDTLLKTIGQTVDISYFTDTSGAVQLYTGGGLTLLDSNPYKLSYAPASGVGAFIGDTGLNAITINRSNANGDIFPPAQTLVSGGSAADITTTLTGGTLKGLLDVRDQKIPAFLDQLDNLAANLRDQINAIHNQGTSYPGAQKYTGTRLINAADSSQWSGQLRIAVLDGQGKPVPSPYNGDLSGVPPLTLDLSTLDGGQGVGKPSVQTIIDAINSYYTPQNKLSLGNMNNIGLVSDSTSIPHGTGFSFDFDLQNLSGTNADFYVSGLSVTDDSGNPVTGTTNTAPAVALASSNTYATTAGNGSVTVTTAAANHLSDGDIIYMPDPGAAVGGIPASSLTGYFKITNVTGTSFDIASLTPATTTTNASIVSLKAIPKYQTILPGDDDRTIDSGKFNVDATSNPTSSYYTVTANLGVADGSGDPGAVKQTTVTFKVMNTASHALNERFQANSIVTGTGTITAPSSTAPLLTAKLVDANGNELGKINGAYTTGVNGYLQLSGGNSSYFVSVDSMDSTQLGSTGTNGTNRGFMGYFDLNDFFNANKLTSTGDTVAGSAINLSVSSRLIDNPDLVSTGSLTLSSQPADPSRPPLYTYETASGDNSIIQRLAGLASTNINFDPAGGLGASNQSFSNYAGNIIGFISSDSTGAKTALSSAQTLLGGLQDRVNSTSGVNLDEELGNTVTYQNAYSASARIVTVVQKLYDDLLGLVQ